jgi:hypothetical protein
MHHPNYSLWYLGSLGTLAISFKRIPVARVTVPSSKGFQLLGLRFLLISYYLLWWDESSGRLLIRVAGYSSLISLHLVIWIFHLFCIGFSFLFFSPCFPERYASCSPVHFLDQLILTFSKKKRVIMWLIVIKWDRDYTSDEPRHWVRGPDIGLNKNSLSLYTDFEISLFTQ